MPGKPILLVEDNPDDEELILLSFRDQKIANEVIVVRDGVEALDYLFTTGRFSDRHSADMPALVIMDLKLPKLNGLEVLQRVRSDPRTRRTPVVILTSSREEADVVRSYDLGANSFVQKPIDFHEFQDVVNELGVYWLLVNQAPNG